MNPNQNKGPIVGAALAGLVMGAVAGILLAPKSGKETREDLAKIGERMRDDLTDRLSKLSDFTRETYKEAVDSIVTKYQDTKEVTADEAKALKEELNTHFDKIKETVEAERTEHTATE